MKLDQLEIFDAVVRAGSFARAANEILLISQPAVSAAIRKLESSLGFALFDRETYRPTLTPQGQAFYSKARELLDESRALGDYARLLANGTEPELRIATEPLALLPELLKVFRQETACFEHTRFEFFDEPVGGAIARLIDNEAELAFARWLPEAYGHLPLEQSLLFSLKISAMIAPDHALAKGDGQLRPEDLAGSIQIVTRSNDRYLPTSGFALQPHARRWYVNDPLTKRQLIQAGLGFGILAFYEVADELASGQLIPFTRLPGYSVFHNEVHLVRRSDRPHGPVASRLWQEFSSLPVLRIDADRSKRV